MHVNVVHETFFKKKVDFQKKYSGKASLCCHGLCMFIQCKRKSPVTDEKKNSNVIKYEISLFIVKLNRL